MISAPASASAPPTTASANAFRAAERSLWDAYGLVAQERWIEVPETRTRVRLQEIGTGDPIIFIGGTGGTGASWAPIVRELPGRRSIILDRPGWGLSSPVDYRTDAYGSIAARVVAAVLDGLDLERVDLVGGSIGAIWVLHAAHRYPDRVGRVVLLGGMPHPDVPLPTFIRLLRSPVGALMVRMPMNDGMLRKQLEALGHGSTLADGGMNAYIAWRLAFQRHTASMRHEREMVRAITRGDGFRPGVTLDADALAGIAQPALMLFGTADPTGNADVWRRFVDRLPHGELELVPDAGHNLFWDDPQGVGRSTRRFLGVA